MAGFLGGLSTEERETADSVPFDELRARNDRMKGKGKCECKARPSQARAKREGVSLWGDSRVGKGNADPFGMTNKEKG